MSAMQLSELAARLSAELIGDGGQTITGVNTIRDATEQQLCFMLSAKYAPELRESKSPAVLTQTRLVDCAMSQLVVRDVQQALIGALQIFAPKLEVCAGVHASAVVDPSARLDASVSVGPCAVIAAGVCIGAGTVIGANCFIGQETVIGQRCRIDAGVAVYHQCVIGNDCIIQAGSAIGAVGFGYYCINGRHQLVPHNGGVIIEDKVEIGANSCVDRAKFGNTVVGAGTKIDNQVMVAHNVRIGKHCLLAGHAGMGGSTRLGDYVVMGGRAGITDNVTIGDRVMMGIGSLTTSDVESGKKVYGYPSQDLQHELKCIAVYQKLPDLIKELKQLRKKVEQLEAAKNH